jgi:ribosomal protein S12 methylthiotransferase
LDVLVDAEVPDEKNAWVGRSYADAPDVDGVVFVSGEGLSTGDMVPCEIVARNGYDLVAAAVGADRKRAL